MSGNNTQNHSTVENSSRAKSFKSSLSFAEQWGEGTSRGLFAAAAACSGGLLMFSLRLWLGDILKCFLNPPWNN